MTTRNKYPAPPGKNIGISRAPGKTIVKDIMYSFEDIIGEEQLKTKMKSVAQSGMHSHAYLIAGDKRCGKTTLANCFVKAHRGRRSRI